MAGILVVAEHLRGRLAAVSGELIGTAVALKEQLGGPLRVAVIGTAPEALADELSLAGVDEILLVDAPTPEFDAVASAHATAELAILVEARLILIGHTVSGMGFGPAVAARLGGGFASDVITVEAVSGGIRAQRGGYANKVLSWMQFANAPLVTLMLRAGGAKVPAALNDIVPRRAVTVDFAPVASLLSEHLGYIDPPPADIDITKAEVIMSIGRGIQDEKNIERFRALADRLGATLGCSRPIADAGWLPKAHQVGLSGKTASNCKLYLALGISGAVQHLHGMKHVETIIAVNIDRNAPIFSAATHGVCADVFEFADALETNFN